MNLRFNKTHIWYGLKFFVAANFVFFSGYFAMRQFYMLRVREPAGPANYFSIYQTDENNPVYAELPKDKPVLLDKKEVLQKKQAMAWEKRDFIFIDLEKMTLSLYRQGGVTNNFAILARGKENGFFDIPSGFYKVQSKSESHWSKTDDRIKLPWSIYLFGNYLIHGWPTLANDRPFYETDAGGVRLASDDAKDLFSKAEEGMTVLVYNDTLDNSTTDFAFFRRSNLPHQVPEVSAAGVLAEDLETGQILFEKNKNDSFPIASVSKLMTATVAMESLKLDDVLTIDREAISAGGTLSGITSGESFKVLDLLYAMILPSANDVATAFRLHDPKFLEKMNGKAKELGMEQTHYQDSSGLSQENISSAGDLFKLLRYVNGKHPDLLKLTAQKDYSLVSLDKKHKYYWLNVNWPRDDKRFLGGKAGWTSNALQTIAGIYGVRLYEYGWRPIVITVLGSRNRIQDVRAIIKYLESSFVYGNVNKKEEAKNPIIQEGASIYQSLR